MNKFDQIINRRGTASAKWDEMDQKIQKEDVIHLGVADMDFEVSPEIQAAIQKVVDQNIYGYSILTDDFYHTIIDWYQKQYKITLEKDWIVFSPRIIISFGAVLDALTQPGDNIISHYPMYSPLTNAVDIRGLELQGYSLELRGEGYRHNLELLEQVINDRSQLLLLCNPHNPTTRCWTMEELEEIAQIAKRENLVIFSDEVHADVLKKDAEFTSLLSVDGIESQPIIIASSPSKAFNIPGLMLSYLIIPSSELREKVTARLDQVGIFNPNPLVEPVLKAAYDRSDNWLDEVQEYIDINEETVRSFFANNFPELKALPREGSFLLWIDYSKLNVSEEDFNDWLVNEAGVTLSLGSDFGSGGDGFVRLNLATARSRLEEALNRMFEAKNQLINNY